MTQRNLRAFLERLTAAIVLTAALVVLAMGCSVERDYKLLTFFFDGVPAPGGTGTTPGTAGLQNPPELSPRLPGISRKVLSTHKPFTEGKCNACHAEGTTTRTPPDQVRLQAIALDSSGCISCHEKTLTAYPKMHAAVTIQKACLWCHAPHDSLHPSLQRTATASLCVQCHDADGLSKREGHPSGPALRTGKSVTCLTCHMAHGGTQSGFLKAQPATAPTPESPAKPKDDPFD